MKMTRKKGRQFHQLYLELEYTNYYELVSLPDKDTSVSMATLGSISVHRVEIN